MLIKKKSIKSAHDISEGGLFVTLAESGFNRLLGFEVKSSYTEIRKDAFWFGEAQGRVVVSIDPSTVSEFESLLDIPFEKLGSVSSGNIIIDDDNWGNIKEWREKYDNAIGNYFKSYMPE
jgi:phosphoribosylformylglycinamidine synthase